MNEELKKISEKIQQEQWVRVPIENFTRHNFEEIDTLMKDLRDEDYDQALEVCEEQLKNNKNSVSALYIAGFINFQKDTINDEYIFILIELFSEHAKWNLVEYLCLKLLDTRSNLRALRKLQTIYSSNSETEKLIPIWEKIVQEDFEEAEIPFLLAQHKLEKGDSSGAMLDFRKSLNRHLQQKNTAKVEEIWKIFLTHDLQNVFLYLNYIPKIETALGAEVSERLLVILLEKLESDSYVDVRINMLKKLLKINPESIPYRERLVNEYRKKYEKHDKLEDFIHMTNLTQSWRNVHEAISDFEKHVSFFPGSFVYHSKWGIGRIKETTHQHLSIDFSKKRDHQMDVAMAVQSLEVLPKHHFWIVRSALTRDKLREKVIKTPEWTLKCILKSLGSADMKTIKSELVPDILTPQEWSSWSVKARKILNTDHHFGILSSKVDHYTFSDVAVSPMEKFYKLLKLESRFLGKVKLYRKAFNLARDLQDQDNLDFFWLIFDYFYTHLHAENAKIDDHYFYSLFVCEEALNTLYYHARDVNIPIERVITELTIPQMKEIIKKIKITDYCHQFFHVVKKYRKDWEEVYLQLFPYFPNEDIIKLLEAERKNKLLEKIYLHIHSNAMKFREAFIWITTQLEPRFWMSGTEKLRSYSNLLRIGIGILRDLANKTDVPLNKRNLETIFTFLFDKGNLNAFLADLTEQEMKYIYSLLSQLNEVIPNKVLDVREQILVRFPDFEFTDKFHFEETSSSGFLATEPLYKKKQSELSHIHEHEIPENSKEIEKARAFGDLKENAEYKAALEQQEALNSRVHRLKQEIEQARVFNFENVNIAMVSFGTRVTLEESLDGEENKTNSFVILGPWESNPEKGIISYLSPLGQKIYKRKVNDTCAFSINNVTRKIKILNIQKVDADFIS